MMIIIILIIIAAAAIWLSIFNSSNRGEIFISKIEYAANNYTIYSLLVFDSYPGSWIRTPSKTKKLPNVSGVPLQAAFYYHLPIDLIRLKCW